MKFSITITNSASRLMEEAMKLSHNLPIEKRALARLEFFHAMEKLEIDASQACELINDAFRVATSDISFKLSGEVITIEKNDLTERAHFFDKIYQKRDSRFAILKTTSIDFEI
jgi:hypothetical protein